MPESLEDTLEKASGAPLLAVTPNPVTKNVVNLGLSELWALVASTVGTTAVSFATANPTVLAVSGPVCEKPMFLARHLVKAVKEFRQSKDKEFWTDFMKPEMRDAARELWMDVAFHDSVYVGLAHALLSHSSLHPGIAATFAFAAAVPAAALLQVGLENTAHRALVALSGVQGVSWEKYMEARFLYQGDAQALQENVRRRYGLDTQISGKYSDEYLAHRLLGLAERAVVARKRVVTGDRPKSGVEMVFTYTTKDSPDDSPYNFFVTHKQKGAMPVADSTDWHSGLPFLLRKTVKPVVEQRIEFGRQTYCNAELSVCVDSLAANPGVSVVELKVFSDKDLLTDAMAYVHRCHEVVQTTRPKSQMADVLVNI